VRDTTVFKRLMDLPGVTVSEVNFQPTRVVVTVKLSSRKLHCPACGFTTRARYDTRPVFSSWRHLDLGRWRLEVRADLRRIDCPTHGARTEGVPFARSGSRFTRDFEDLVGWLATSMDKTALCRLVRIDWATTGRIIERVMATGLDPKRLDNLFVCGADEVSWRKGHSYLTLVSNNDTGKFVWGKEGKDTATLDCFFDELGEERSAAITAMSMDMGPAFEKSARKPGHATKAVICFDPFHVVQAGTKALEKVRRQVWQDLRTLPDQDAARRFKGARWCLLKNPGDLTDDQSATLRKIKRRGGDLWRAYALKEALRAIFGGDLTEDEVAMLLDRFCSRAQRSGMKPFVTLAKTIRKRREGILAAVRMGVNNARHEGLNRRVRLIINRAYGFHSANAALALIMVTLGPIEHVLPHERQSTADP
jgi:transposase